MSRILASCRRIKRESVQIVTPVLMGSSVSQTVVGAAIAAGSQEEKGIWSHRKQADLALDTFPKAILIM